MWGEAARGQKVGQNRLVVGPARNRLLLRLLGRQGLFEVLFVVPHVYHVAEVCVGAARLGRGVDGVSLPRRRVDGVSLSRSRADGVSLMPSPRRRFTNAGHAPGMPKMTSAMYTMIPMVIQVAAPTPV